jgi:hypothetical protein
MRRRDAVLTPFVRQSDSAILFVLIPSSSAVKKILFVVVGRQKESLRAQVSFEFQLQFHYCIISIITTMAPNVRFDSLLRGANPNEDSDDERSTTFQTQAESERDVGDFHLATAKAQGWKLWKDRLDQGGKNVHASSATRTCAASPDSAVADRLFLDQALASVRMLDSSERQSNKDWLESFHGELHDVPTSLLERIKANAPQKFAARVADFNENLMYQMQTQHGLSHLGVEDQDLQALVPAHEHLGSFLTTESTVPQPAHVDFPWKVLEDTTISTQGGSKKTDLSLGFFPLTAEGMFLQVWPRQDDPCVSEIPGHLVFIPLGKLLVLPASTIHGGGFRTTPLYIPAEDEDFSSSSSSSSCFQQDDNHTTNFTYQENGNLRFHLYMARGTTHRLPTHQTNKYTEPHDKRRELCERYVDAPYMQVLQQHLFV